MELSDCRVDGLHFPFVVIIDYRGFRLIAESVLPVSPHTIVYGSSDGGKSVHCESSEMSKRLAKAAQILNLAPHEVWNWEKTKKVTVVTPIDCEGHIGLDNRFYIIDTARLFPPEVPIPGLKGSHLYRLLRPELVKKNPVPLCSDAFSRFLLENRQKFEQDIVEITQRLYKVIIPEAALELSDYYLKNPLDPEQDMNDEFTRLISELHRKGINLRFLGEIRKHSLPNVPYLKNFLLTEIVARTIKNVLRLHMRKLQTPHESRYRKLILTYFNLMFGNGPKCIEFWKIYAKDRVAKTFSNSLTEEELNPNFMLRDRILTLSLFKRLQRLIGAKFEDSALNKFKKDNEFNPCLAVLTTDLQEQDLDKIYPIVRYTNRLAFEEGTLFSKKAVADSTHGEADEYFKMASQKYHDALTIKPDDYRALHNWGLLLILQASRKKGPEAERLYQEAEQKLKEALVVNPNDARAFLLWGNLLLERSGRTSDPRTSTRLLTEACLLYQRSFKIQPKQYDLLYNWGNALLFRGKSENEPIIYEQAMEKYALALELKPKSYNALKNWGVCLAKYARCLYSKDRSNFQQAEKFYELAGQKFQHCLQLKEHDRGVYFNWGNALYRRAKMHQSEGQIKTCYNFLSLASEKYLSALNLKLNDRDALYNWGKVLECQARLNYDYPLHEFLFAVNYYLEVFKTVAVRFKGSVKLEPLIALVKTPNKQVQQKAFNLLKFLCQVKKSDSNLHIEASRAMKKLLDTNQIQVSTENPTNSQSDLPLLVSQILQTLGSAEKDIDESEDHEVTLDDFKIISEIEGSARTLGKLYKVCREHSSELYIMTIIEKQQMHERMGYKEDGTLLLSNSKVSIQPSTTTKDEKEALKKNYFATLKQNIPFFVTLQHLLRTEANDYCLVFKCLYNPGLLFNHFRAMDNTVNDHSDQNSQAVMDRRNAKIEKELQYYAAEMVTLIERIHELGLILGDCSPQEVLLDKDGHLSILKLPFSSHARITASATLPEYTPPEVITGEEYNSDSDWYCFGLWVYELYHGQSPFFEKNSYQVFNNILSGDVKFSPQISTDLKSLITELIYKDKNKRLKLVEAIKAHPFFNGVNWSDVAEKTTDPPFKPVFKLFSNRAVIIKKITYRECSL